MYSSCSDELSDGQDDFWEAFWQEAEKEDLYEEARQYLRQCDKDEADGNDHSKSSDAPP